MRGKSLKCHELWTAAQMSWVVDLLQWKLLAAGCCSNLLVFLPTMLIICCWRWNLICNDWWDHLILHLEARHCLFGAKMEQGVDFDYFYSPFISTHCIRVFLAFCTFTNFEMNNCQLLRKTQWFWKRGQIRGDLSSSENRKSPVRPLPTTSVLSRIFEWSLISLSIHYLHQVGRPKTNAQFHSLAG